MKLNDKHNVFIETYLINGYNGIDAYLIAYPKASYDTARANSTKLLAKTDIKEIINTKKKELADKCTITKMDIVNVVISIMNDNNSKSSDRLKATEILFKALGYNAPTETNISLNVEQPLFKDPNE